MGSSINSVKVQATNLKDSLFAGGTLDSRIGVVGFKDTTNGEPSSVILPFTDQNSFAARKAAAISAIQSITVGGGGDLPETAYDGLRLALDGHMGEWRAGAGILRIALFTDAPAKDGALAGQVTALAKSIGATFVPTASFLMVGGGVDTFSVSIDHPVSARSALDTEDLTDLPFDPLADVPVGFDDFDGGGADLHHLHRPERNRHRRPAGDR